MKKPRSCVNLNSFLFVYRREVIVIHIYKAYQFIKNVLQFRK